MSRTAELLGERFVFVVDRHALVPLQPAIVVVGGEALQIGLEDGLLDPPVEPEQLRLVFVNDLAAAGQPVFEERGVGPRLHIQAVAVVRQRDGRAVEIGVGRVLHIRVEVAAAVEEPPVLGAVAGDAEYHALLPGRRGQLADDIALRPHLGRGPVAQRAVVHREPVVMLRHGDDELRARPAEQIGPCGRVELLRREHRDEVLVAELRLVAEHLLVIDELARVLQIHVARVPFVAEGRHAIGPPVDEDAELAVFVPRRDLIGLQRCPGGLELGWLGGQSHSPDG